MNFILLKFDMLIWVLIEILNIVALWLFGLEKDCGRMLVECSGYRGKHLPRKGAWRRGGAKKEKKNSQMRRNKANKSV
jgi:hypothetical protein